MFRKKTVIIISEKNSVVMSKKTVSWRKSDSENRFKP